MSERWLPVLGWEALYEVSDQGRVRSKLREVASGKNSRALRGGRVLKHANTGGYFHLTLSNAPVEKNFRVHVLVAEAFLGPRPEEMNACHKDGDSTNNVPANLYWGTQLQNIRDKVRHGTDRFALKRGHCAHGHIFDQTNTYLTATGSPICRTCRRDGMRNRKAA